MSAESEKQVATAVAFLREKMPEHFIVIAKIDGQIVTMGGFNLESARDMLKGGMEAVSEQYAYHTAKSAFKP